MLTKKEVLDKSDKEFVKWCIKICPQITKNTDFIYENINLFRDIVDKNYKPKIYYGETKCCEIIKSTKEKCANGGYFEYQGKIYCGVHSSKLTDKKKLLKNPNKDLVENELIALRNIQIKEQAQLNFEYGKKGNVIVSKVLMMKKPILVDGYLAVFSNYKDQNKKEGYGASSLSPKSLGPIPYFSDILPTSYNLENFHQFSKIFTVDLIDSPEKTIALKKIEELEQKYKQNKLKKDKDFYEKIIELLKDVKINMDTIKKGFLDKEPHRHKYTITNGNIPYFSVFYDIHGKEHRFTYLKCRYFYCKWYEILVKDKNNKDFLYLKDQMQKGVNLQIIGYDGYDVDNKSIYNCYLDTTKPFGHELVLYTLLTEKPENYPWDKYSKLNPELYKNFEFIS